MNTIPQIFKKSSTYFGNQNKIMRIAGVAKQFVDIKLGEKYFLTLTSYNVSMSKASVKLGLVIETGICYAKSKQDGQSVA